ncbi:MAG: hypothetical protein NW202_03615 [Nitrospira sp.]|nr:hypothetical protein [Nitrospira sp.]
MHEPLLSKLDAGVGSVGSVAFERYLVWLAGRVNEPPTSELGNSATSHGEDLWQ